MDRPLDGKVHIVALQRPDILGERCTVLVPGVPKRLLVVVEPLFNPIQGRLFWSSGGQGGGGGHKVPP